MEALAGREQRHRPAALLQLVVQALVRRALLAHRAHGEVVDPAQRLAAVHVLDQRGEHELLAAVDGQRGDEEVLAPTRRALTGSSRSHIATRPSAASTSRRTRADSRRGRTAAIRARGLPSRPKAGRAPLTFDVLCAPTSRRASWRNAACGRCRVPVSLAGAVAFGFAFVVPLDQGLVFRDVDRLAGHARLQRAHGRAVDERGLPARARLGSLRPHDERQGALSRRPVNRTLAGRVDDVAPRCRQSPRRTPEATNLRRDPSPRSRRGRQRPRAEGLRQRAQQRRAIPAPRAAVHARQHLRLLARQALQDRGGVRRVRVVVHRRAERFARPEDVGLGDRRRAAAALREEVAAEQRARLASPS